MLTRGASSAAFDGIPPNPVMFRHGRVRTELFGARKRKNRAEKTLPRYVRENQNESKDNGDQPSQEQPGYRMGEIERQAQAAALLDH